MTRNDIRKMIIYAVKEYIETQDLNEEVDGNTTLFGDQAILDSLGLVNVIIDIESKFLDEGIEISLTSEKAMSRRTSPFRNIATLVDFASDQIGVGNE